MLGKDSTHYSYLNVFACGLKKQDLAKLSFITIIIIIYYYYFLYFWRQQEQVNAKTTVSHLSEIFVYQT